MRTDTPIKNEHVRINDTLYIAKEEDVLSVSKRLIEQNRQAYEELANDNYSLV